MEWVATDRFKKSLQPPRSSDRRLLQQNLPGAEVNKIDILKSEGGGFHL
jgi:hypothetical protein